MQGKTESISKLMKNDSASFKIIFILCFVTFFMGALFALVLPMQWRGWLPGSEGDKSFFESVKVGVYSFMSYLTQEKHYVENLETIRPIAGDGSSRRFSLCFGSYDSFGFIEHKSIQMARWYVTGAIFAVSRREVKSITKPWKWLVTIFFQARILLCSLIL